jgi:hypothetical protein
MNLRSAYSTRTPLYWALVFASILLIPSAGWAQSLTGSANPASGGAGVSYSYLTGSGFPAGGITGATVHLGTNCAAPAIASGPVAQVTTQGVLRRFQFLIPASVAPGSYKIWLSGTAGATAFNTLNTPSCSAISVTSNVTGTASLGAAISGGIVTLVDATGRTATGTTASDGTFLLDSSALTPPYLVRVVTTTASGNYPAGTTLYSVSADPNASAHINVHVLSDLMLRSFYSAQGIDPDTAFASPLGADAAPTPTAVQGLASLAISASQLWLGNAGVNATAGAPANGAINLISSPFTTYPPGATPAGLDAVLHIITSEALVSISGTSVASTSNPGAVSLITFVNGTITETLAPTYPGGGAIVFNTTTTNTANGGSTSAASFSGLALTPAQQSVVDGINASLATFASIINTKGSALTGTDLLPTYAPDYLNDGDNATQDANNFALQNAGLVINSLQVFSLKSLDTVNSVADVLIAYDITFGGQNQTGHDFEIIFKNESGTWLQYGDQKIGQVSANSETRTSEGADSIRSRVPGLYFQTDIFAGVQAPTSLGVTGATVSGGGSIWNGAASGALFHEAQFIQNGQTFDNFVLLSQPLTLATIPPPGTTFTFNLTTASSGNPTYTAQNNAFTTERIVIFANVTAGNGPLSSVVGKTITYNWTLPTTYPIGQVSLFAYINDGPGNLPTTHSCNVNSASPLGVTSTSGSITIPSDMSACGLSSSDAIQQVGVFVEVDGVNGEESIVLLSYPY